MEELYHVRIQTTNKTEPELIKLGLSREQLEGRVVNPYQEGSTITLSGRSIPTNEIKQIQISTGFKPVPLLLEQARQEDAASNFFGGAIYQEHLAFTNCREVTDDFITGPPGHKKKLQTPLVQNTGGKRIFIVHGHDGGLKNAAARFIESLGLEPVILHEQPDLGRTIIEKFEEESSAAFAVVLATPDDKAESAGEPTTAQSESKSRRARQNVIFELGFFIGRLGRKKAILITDPAVDLPSDLSGVIYANRGEWQRKLLQSLTADGFTFTQEQIQDALAIQE